MGIYFYPMCFMWGQEEREPSRGLSDGNTGASRGLLNWQQYQILLPLGWAERAGLMLHSLCPGGRCSCGLGSWETTPAKSGHVLQLLREENARGGVSHCCCMAASPTLEWLHGICRQEGRQQGWGRLATCCASKPVPKARLKVPRVRNIYQTASAKFLHCTVQTIWSIQPLP